MSWPFLLKNLDLKRASVTRRLPVREQGPNGLRTGPVDHFTESGINPATKPLDAITHETVDHFLSLLLVCLKGGMPPKMWKRDASKAFRFFLSCKICARWCLDMKDPSGCPNTNPCPLARRLQSMVGIEFAAYYVTSWSAFSWPHAADTSRISLASILWDASAQVGFASLKCAVCWVSPPTHNATNLTILGAKVVVDTEKQNNCCGSK